MYIIKTENLQFMNILNYADINIPTNNFTFLQGRSGSGKSTLLKLINATTSPSAGRILYNGKDINEFDTIDLRRDLLLASQDPFLFEGTIRDNFKAFYDFRDNVCITEKGMMTFLEICCAPFSLDTSCNILSGGERQRVFMAICLSFMPKMLMLDEPTAALDHDTAVRFFRQMKDFCKQSQISLLAICHSADLIKEFADHVIILGEGEKND